MSVMGSILWNPESNYDELAVDYFDTAFGPDARQAQTDLEALGGLLDLTWPQEGGFNYGF
jgi:hypothetical protein